MESDSRPLVGPPHRFANRRCLPIAMGCLLAVATPWCLIQLARAGERSGNPHGQTVQVLIDYGNGVRKHYTRIPWRHKMTVLDAMNRAKDCRPGITLTQTGAGSTTLIKGIDGIQNQGGGEGKRNWLYWVNDSIGDVGIGAKALDVGDVVIWRFDTYP